MEVSWINKENIVNVGQSGNGSPEVMSREMNPRGRMESDKLGAE